MYNVCNFNPYKDKPKVTLAVQPMLYFGAEALKKTQLYVDNCDKEIGWLGTVEQVGKGSGVYYCDNVYLLHQDVGACTTEIQPADMVAFAEEVGDSVVEKTKLWGHSHVDMATTPSSQDDEQVSLFKKNGLPFFFRVIANKRGSMTVTFYDFENGITIEDMPWFMYCPVDVDEEAVKKEISEKVKTLPLGKSKWASYGNYYSTYVASPTDKVNEAYAEISNRVDAGLLDIDTVSVAAVCDVKNAAAVCGIYNYADDDVVSAAEDYLEDMGYYDMLDEMTVVDRLYEDVDSGEVSVKELGKLKPDTVTRLCKKYDCSEAVLRDNVRVFLGSDY